MLLGLIMQGLFGSLSLAQDLSGDINTSQIVGGNLNIYQEVNNLPASVHQD